MTLLSAGCIVLFLGLASNALLSSRSSKAPLSKLADGKADIVQPQALPGNPDSGPAIDTAQVSDNPQALQPTATSETQNTLEPLQTRTRTVRESDVSDHTGSTQASSEVSSVGTLAAVSVANSPSVSVSAERTTIKTAAKEQPLIRQPLSETTAAEPASVAPTQVAMLDQSIDTALDDSSILRADESAGLLEEPSRPPAISDTDLGILSRRFHELKEAIMQRDVETISRLTEDSLETNQLIFRLFDTFESFEVEVSNITAARSQQLVQAKLEFGYLLRSNGNRQLAPNVLRDMTLKVYRESDSWSQIQW